MNKPASELIALADRISGHLGPFNFITRAERELVVTTLRTAANQSGSERARVDALREAFSRGLDAAAFYLEALHDDDPVIESFAKDHAEAIRGLDDAALATPPAQPAPASDGGKS